MPLPILQAHSNPTPQDLVRLFHRTQLHWMRHVGDEMQLDAGVAITNRGLPNIWDANGVIEAAVPPGASPADTVDEVRQHFGQAGTTCRQWILNPSAAESQTVPLADYLQSVGYVPRSYDIMLLGGRSPGQITEAQGLTIIPARASFRHARELAQEDAAECGVPELVDASMLHLDDPHWDASIALRNGTAVARAGVLAVGEIGRVEHVFVTASHRRQGIGRTMVARLLALCSRSLFKHVMLCVHPENRSAINLCAAFGFRKIGQMVAYRVPSTADMTRPEYQ
jgi:ribosomal protein S18 acetylase RimI-like enzyme